ncbi:HEPN domain-containing protein [Marinoscillum pacificum]|uniref:HEPN domain-containing protein n=1 Tax=Marinoscillum pacificum TaxID=392723 RepID=UPI00215751E3|nr:HEPN domain-containing protein [Marinoscillum pacificum]
MTKRKHKLENLKQSLYEVFDPQDINCIHEELWRWIKAASNNELYLHMGDPSFILFMERKFKRMIRYAWHLHQKHKEEFVAEHQMLSPLSEECIEQQRQHMLQLDDLITRYKGTVRRLSKAETENPLLFFHRFFQYINSKKEWYQILHSWAEYSLSRSSMLDFSNDVDLEAFELIEGLLESMYLLHLQDHPNQEYLDPVVKLIIEALAPQMIFEVRHPSVGNQNTSITELLIVVPDSRQKRLSELEPIIDLITVSDRFFSCSLHTSSHIIDKLKSGHIYFSLVCISQNLIYGSLNSLPFNGDADAIKLRQSMPSLSKRGCRVSSKNELNLIALREDAEGRGVLPETLSQVIAETQKTFDTGHQKAQAFHTSALNQSERSLGLFMLQQAAELIFRTVALVLYGCEKKTHSFKALKQITRRVAPALNEVLPANTSEEKRLLQLLEDAYINGRYANDFEVSDADFQTLNHRVEKLLSLSREIVNDRIALVLNTSEESILVHS